MTAALIKKFCANCKWHTLGMKYHGKPCIHWCNDYMRNCKDIDICMIAGYESWRNKKEAGK
jgi:hypothetical protein